MLPPRSFKAGFCMSRGSLPRMCNQVAQVVRGIIKQLCGKGNES